MKFDKEWLEFINRSEAEVKVGLLETANSINLQEIGVLKELLHKSEANTHEARYWARRMIASATKRGGN